MTTQIERLPATSSPKSETSGAVLIATDGTSQSDGAIATGCALAAMLGGGVRVVAVERPLRLAVPDTPELIDPRIKIRLTADLMGLVRSQCARIVPVTPDSSTVQP